MNIMTSWFQRHFSDPQILFLALALVSVFAVVLILGHMLAPVLASLIIAYLLEGPVGYLVRRGLPRLVCVILIYALFMLFVALILLGVMPLVSRQITELAQQLPNMIAEGTRFLMICPAIIRNSSPPHSLTS